MSRKAWTTDQTTIAFALYCITPLKQIKPANPLIVQISELTGYTPDSIAAAMRNFQCLDPAAKSGASHYSKQMHSVFEKYKNDWGALSIEAERLTGLALFDTDALHGAKSLSDLTNHNQVTRERYFFKKAVLSTYENTCYVSGCAVSKFLIASHIKPYNKCKNANDRISPENGICLNTFYDRAFDQGLMTITPQRKVYIAPALLIEPDDFTREWLCKLDGLELPAVKRFPPKAEFLEYHNDIIFRNGNIV